MIKSPPSIFNDVIRPVMRGPSSSHLAAAHRIGDLARQMVKRELREVIAEFPKDTPLAETYHGHGSDIGLVGGLLGIGLTDDCIINALDLAKKHGVDVSFRIVEEPAKHPNLYKMTLRGNKKEIVHFTAISVGGGMIEIQEIEGFKVSISGDFYETLVFLKEESREHYEAIKNVIKNFEYCEYITNDQHALVNIKTTYKLPGEIVEYLESFNFVEKVIQLNPVLPILSRKNCVVPFRTVSEMLQIASEKNLELWELGVMYESARGNISQQEVINRMREIVSIMKSAIQKGLEGTCYEDRILGPQAYLIEKHKDKLIPDNLVNRVIAYITAIMEVKSAMGVIVAAPTAGACATLPGVIIGTATELEVGLDEIVKAMLAAGIIGVIIADKTGFAAEMGGCQLECGAASAMAAAGLVQLAGGTPEQGVDGASIALQNILGLVCDPVGGRVEWPCLGRNIIAGVNAIASANMALAGYDKVIPLEETLSAMKEVGDLMHPKLRCTGLGGLSVTQTSEKIYKELKQRAKRK